MPAIATNTEVATLKLNFWLVLSDILKVGCPFEYLAIIRKFIETNQSKTSQTLEPLSAHCGYKNPLEI